MFIFPLMTETFLPHECFFPIQMYRNLNLTYLGLSLEQTYIPDTLKQVSCFPASGFWRRKSFNSFYHVADILIQVPLPFEHIFVSSPMVTPYEMLSASARKFHQRNDLYMYIAAWLQLAQGLQKLSRLRCRRRTVEPSILKARVDPSTRGKMDISWMLNG